MERLASILISLSICVEKLLVSRAVACPATGETLSMQEGRKNAGLLSSQLEPGREDDGKAAVRFAVWVDREGGRDEGE